jgi:hypothetical protein
MLILEWRRLLCMERLKKGKVKMSCRPLMDPKTAKREHQCTLQYAMRSPSWIVGERLEATRLLPSNGEMLILEWRRLLCMERLKNER